MSTASLDQRVPITLLVDDVTPAYNLYYYYLRQVEFCAMRRPVIAFGPDRQIMSSRIPLELLRRFGALALAEGLQGKMSLVPYPAGMGSITRSLTGVAPEELQGFLELFRRTIAPRFDVTPELLTHTRKLNLQTELLEDISEAEWSKNCSVEQLEAYIGHAVAQLRAVGLAPTGITSPLDFGYGNEPSYSEAIVRALAAVSASHVSWYFLHQTFGCPARLSAVYYYLQDRLRACVHIPATVPDYLMGLYNQTPSAKLRAQIADLYISLDGKNGTIISQLDSGTQMVSLLVHWSALYLNGHYEGLAILSDVIARIRCHLSHRVVWMKPHHIALKVVKNEMQARRRGFKVPLILRL